MAEKTNVGPLKGLKVIDLTHPTAPHMPLYPGTPAPKLTVAYTCEKDKFQDKYGIYHQL